MDRRQSASPPPPSRSSGCRDGSCSSRASATTPPYPAQTADAHRTFELLHTWLGKVLGETIGYALTATFTVLVVLGVTRAIAPRWMSFLGYAVGRTDRHRRRHPPRCRRGDHHQLRRLRGLVPVAHRHGRRPLAHPARRGEGHRSQRINIVGCEAISRVNSSSCAAPAPLGPWTSGDHGEDRHRRDHEPPDEVRRPAVLARRGRGRGAVGRQADRRAAERRASPGCRAARSRPRCSTGRPRSRRRTRSRPSSSTNGRPGSPPADLAKVTADAATFAPDPESRRRGDRADALRRRAGGPDRRAAQSRSGRLGQGRRRGRRR